MTAEVPTLEQQQFAEHPNAAFLEACPGAGKTRTIVARASSIANNLPPRKGLAILSFTNCAVKEFNKRCCETGNQQILRHPHFVGTFDAFIRHFLVLPFGIAESGERPTIVDSWDSLGIEIRLSGQNAFAGQGVSLDKFEPESNTIDPNTIGIPALRTHVRQNISAYQASAAQRRRSLRRAGFLTAADARLEAAKRIKTITWGPALGQMLQGRFCEVIIDEAQDCNTLDLDILSWLRRHGLRVTIVCDPDQAIYEFRSGLPASLRAFCSQYPPSDQLSLTGNFRCSPAICALAATLRARREPDQSIGETNSVSHPITLVEYDGQTPPSSIGDFFLKCLQSPAIAVSTSNAIVLSHTLNAALTAAGAPPVGATGGKSRLAELARATCQFWSPSATDRSRETSLRTMEATILHFMGVWQPGDCHPQQVANRNGINPRQLRRQAFEAMMAIPRTCEATEDGRSRWAECLRSALESLTLPLPAGQTAVRFLRLPKNSSWSQHLQGLGTHALTTSTIHEAKGREYEAVCVVIKPDRSPENRTTQLLQAWENRTELEAKRVIYVAVTRAKRLVVLAVPKAVANRCAAILARENVPCERMALTTDAPQRSVGPRKRRTSNESATAPAKERTPIPASQGAPASPELRP
jgi:hypothetical protein